MGVEPAASDVASLPVTVVGAGTAAVGQNWHEPRELTDDEREAVLAFVREHRGCSIREAALAAGVHRADVKKTRKESSDFEDDWRNAQGYGSETVMAQMVKLAIDGVDEPVVSAGAIVGSKKVYDSRALENLWKMTPEGRATIAARLGVEISGPEGGPIQIQRGVELDAVLGVLQAARVAGALEAPDGTAEIVAVDDEPA